MKLIVGLGNPGSKYAMTRHNVGFMVVDELKKELGIESYKASKSTKAEYAWKSVGEEEIELFKPMTFMNHSGVSVAVAKKKHQGLKLSDIYIIHDDLDINLGEYKIQEGKGPRDHKGILSVEKSLGKKDFWRIRVGVENRDHPKKISGEDYVLQKFNKEELDTVGRVIVKIIKELKENVFN